MRAKPRRCFSCDHEVQDQYREFPKYDTFCGNIFVQFVRLGSLGRASLVNAAIAQDCPCYKKRRTE